MGSKPKTKNDIAWEKLFSKYNITDEVEKHGYYEIDSKKINEFREARLMTKFDHRSNLPILFEKNKLAILPITRGTYGLATPFWTKLLRTRNYFHFSSYPASFRVLNFLYSIGVKYPKEPWILRLLYQ